MLTLQILATAAASDFGPRDLPETTGAVVGHAYVERLVAPVGSVDDVDPDLYDTLLERAAGRAPVGVSEVRLEAATPWGVQPLQALLPVPPPVPDKDPPATGQRGAPADLPGATVGGLSGRAVYLSQCHGYIWYDALGRFSTQRGILHSTVEDMHNPEGANLLFSRYLENAGAAVYATKERGINPEMALSDNDGAGYTEVGAGFVNGAAGFADDSPWTYGEDPFDAGTTRTFPADGGGVATWQPTIPSDGTYAVYVSWDASSGHATDAHYQINHPGGTIDRWYDQTVHGSTWQYVETLWLTSGASLTVDLVADSGDVGALLSADAVRVGGGMADVQRQGVTSGRPRWEGGAIQYTQFNGAPSSIYDPFGDGTGSDGGSDPSARSRWADWEHPSGEDAVFVSWHSNAGGGAARGTSTYWGGDCAATGSYDLSAAIHDEMIDATETFWDPSWQDRGVLSSCFSELNGSNNDEMPATLIELAFHDNAVDADHLKHPVYRDDMSRAMYRGVVRYFAERDGTAATYLPEPPVSVALVHDPAGGLEASWLPGPVGAPYGDAPDRYLVFRSADGRAWDSGTEVVGTTWSLVADVDEEVYIRVAALNAGGASFPSEIVGAVRSGYGTPPVLIVGAFDRLDRGLLDLVTLPNIGTTVRMDHSRMNPGDVVAVHGRAVAASGYAFDSLSDEALDRIDPSPYLAVIWATGEESTVDETFSDVQQDLIRDHIDGGGTLFTSGAEILWDLDTQGSVSDQDFALDVLGATLANDAASTTVVDGEGILAGVPMDFGVADGAPYPVEYPDVLATDRTVMARYGDGGIAGTLDVGVAVLGYPFEAIGDEGSRNDVMGAILDALLLGFTPPTDPTTTPGPQDTGGIEDTGTTGTPPPTRPGGDGVLPDGYVREPLRGAGCSCDTGSAPGLFAFAWGALLLRRRRT